MGSPGYEEDFEHESPPQKQIPKVPAQKQEARKGSDQATSNPTEKKPEKKSSDPAKSLKDEKPLREEKPLRDEKPLNDSRDAFNSKMGTGDSSKFGTLGNTQGSGLDLGTRKGLDSAKEDRSQVQAQLEKDLGDDLHLFQGAQDSRPKVVEEESKTVKIKAPEKEKQDSGADDEKTKKMAPASDIETFIPSTRPKRTIGMAGKKTDPKPEETTKPTISHQEPVKVEASTESKPTDNDLEFL